MKQHNEWWIVELRLKGDGWRYVGQAATTEPEAQRFADKAERAFSPETEARVTRVVRA